MKFQNLTLMATSRPVLISFARKTHEKLPSPISFPNKKSSGVARRLSWDPRVEFWPGEVMILTKLYGQKIALFLFYFYGEENILISSLTWSLLLRKSPNLFTKNAKMMLQKSGNADNAVKASLQIWGISWYKFSTIQFKIPKNASKLGLVFENICISANVSLKSFQKC